MTPRKPIEFNKPWLIACEGPGDKNILDRLVGRAGLGDHFDVRFPGRELGCGSGRGAIPVWLDLSYSTSPTFRENVKAILVIADNDDDPQKSFDELIAGFRKSKDLKLGIPTVAKEVAKAAGFPTFVILMVPDGREGAIESLCLEALFSKHAIQNEVESYVAATPATGWGPTKQSKARLQAAFAGTFESRPEVGLANMHADDHPLPVNHASFNEIVEFLLKFATLIA